MNKTDLIKTVAETTGSTQIEAKAHVEATLEAIMATVAQGEAVTLIGFGSLTPVDVAERVVRVPMTGEKRVSPPTRRIKFKAGTNFAKRVVDATPEGA